MTTDWTNKFQNKITIILTNIKDTVGTITKLTSIIQIKIILKINHHNGKLVK